MNKPQGDNGKTGNYFLLGLFIQCFVGLQQASAATYYVSPSGNDSNNGSSISTSFENVSLSVTIPNSTARIAVWTWKNAGSGYLFVDDIKIFKK